MKRPTAAMFKPHIALSSKSHQRQKESRVASYCEAVSYLLKKNPTDDVIAEPDEDMITFAQLSNELPTEYIEELIG